MSSIPANHPSTATSRALAWALPPLVFLSVYWLGLWVWFHTDDFSLLWTVMLPDSEFWPQLLTPRAQGTLRPLSERLFFRFFYEAFGLNAFPYRAWVFGSQIVNLWLFAALARRLTGSWPTATLAACLWGVHHGLAVAMSWSSAYNQALFSFFVLVGLHAWARFCEGGGWGWYLLQWLIVPLGFGALESMVVYPALALLYGLCFRRRRWVWALPLFAVSAGLTAFQMSVRPPDDSGLYAMSLAPLSLFDTFVQYVEWGFVGRACESWAPAAWALGPALLAFAAWQWSKGRAAALFGCGLFVAALAPYLPLAGHRSDYYLFLPAAGLALAAAEASRAAWLSGWPARAGVAAALGFCVWTWVATARSIVDYGYETSIRARNLVTGLRYVRERNPNKTILLSGVDASFFYASIYHDLFQLAGVYDVYLTPDQTTVEQWPGYQPIDRFILPAADALLELRRDTAVVYDASGMRLQEQTRKYKLRAPARLKALAR
ncbi:MAG: hypothetical protein GC160_19320 [Acidobacteria bacterium]|nr:hypothetical protein [Acidobacteriota bacterium]